MFSAAKKSLQENKKNHCKRLYFFAVQTILPENTKHFIAKRLTTEEFLFDYIINVFVGKYKHVHILWQIFLPLNVTFGSKNFYWEIPTFSSLIIIGKSLTFNLEILLSSIFTHLNIIEV